MSECGAAVHARIEKPLDFCNSILDARGEHRQVGSLRAVEESAMGQGRGPGIRDWGLGEDCANDCVVRYLIR